MFVMELAGVDVDKCGWDLINEDICDSTLLSQQDNWRRRFVLVMGLMAIMMELYKAPTDVDAALDPCRPLG